MQFPAVSAIPSFNFLLNVFTYLQSNKIRKEKGVSSDLLVLVTKLRLGAGRRRAASVSRTPTGRLAFCSLPSYTLDLHILQQRSKSNLFQEPSVSVEGVKSCAVDGLETIPIEQTSGRFSSNSSEKDIMLSVEKNIILFSNHVLQCISVFADTKAFRRNTGVRKTFPDR